MNRTFFLTIALAVLTQQGWAQLEGYEYGKAKAPDGTEWQSPERLAYNKLQPRASFTSFASVEEARKVLPEYSSRL